MRALGVGSVVRGAGEGATGGNARGTTGSDFGIAGGHVEPLGAATGVFVLDNIGRTPAGVAPRAIARGGGDAGRSSPQLTAAPTGINPPHTEQRARIDTLVILAGSSRKTERHSGQDTFIGNAGLAVSGSRAVVGPA